MRQTTTVVPTTLSETAYLSILLNKAVESQYSVAVWRLPNDPTRHLILSRQIRKINHEVPLEELSAGFLFSKFNRNHDRIFFPADYKFSFSNGSLKPSDSILEDQSQSWATGFLDKSTQPSLPRFYPSKNVSEARDVSFEDLVNDCVKEIDKGRFEKVVPSRRRRIDLSSDFDVVAAFQKLCDAYPNALVSFVSSPETGSWLGATPEVLVSVEDKTTFRTVALAGTKPYHEGINLKSVAWTQKEIEEQALVERYIISCFKKIRVREYEEHGPKTVVAGNLMHLKSDFMVDMKAINFPQLGSVMLQLLHPTSAVCGMPLETAQKFLEENEGYDREYYSGYLGPVNVGTNINLFVNLRCMQLSDGAGWLYAGAGVTADSVPEQELAETNIKLSTLLSVILD
jgi:isochorismate synthase